MKFLFVVNSSCFFKSHFLHLALAVKSKGHDIYIAAGDDKQRKYFESLGFGFDLLPMSRSGKNIFSELVTLNAIRKIFSKYRPDYVHAFTIKPVLYGGVVNKVLLNFRPKKMVFSVTGLGSASMSDNIGGKLLWKILKLVYKFIFSAKNTSVIFENSDDQNLFLRFNVVKENSYIVNGAGVDVNEFSPSSDKPNPVKVILVARLLKDKGVREFIDAGCILNEKKVPVELLLVGATDLDNPSSMTDDEIDLASTSGNVQVLGFKTDVAECYRNANIACLPSYREGLPKSLIEAASCGLPIITTDVPGCRQMVHGGENGILVPVKDSVSLAQAIETLVNNADMRINMGIRSREIAEHKYSKETIISSFFCIYDLDEDSCHEL
ncbi:glycosyltransferase family 4 protein [Vibrio parahaemolyticus]|uniref:Glycosyl transferase n=1 Tax=Vibrio parahaemolyticus TaxID=670 RepID=A0A5P5X5S0_VIBPH|nr:glycosyltransferase family 4 protein [Vibrio parahaemolyticus]EGQ8004213.1 glycosyltransferase family 4 protein [Vibrio parahaemolyticus]EGQ9073513.1 glycosyltransferase [Vibrio parahaemolyticus]EHR4993009.1 glycosyltransferase family 4 protein [Vibrio parahaemolyticus]EHR6401841.1 glycosyltransferase family 4 protein [Vibrio parahaemolyticus]EHR6683607.1 glycosyltransferase family 4 protein [Vibrio parahaemolyticus]